MEDTIAKENLKLENVVRLRIWLHEISESDEVIRAASKFFKYYRPAATFAESSNFIHNDSLVQIEADIVTDINNND